MDIEKWIKLNTYLRIAIILILLVIGIAILKNKYGSPPNMEDMKLTRETGLKVTDCREALIFYANQKLKIITDENATRLYREFNFSNFSFVK